MDSCTVHLGQAARGWAVVGVLWLKGSARKAGSWKSGQLSSRMSLESICDGLYLYSQTPQKNSKHAKLYRIQINTNYHMLSCSSPSCLIEHGGHGCSLGRPQSDSNNRPWRNSTRSSKPQKPDCEMGTRSKRCRSGDTPAPWCHHDQLILIEVSKKKLRRNKQSNRKTSSRHLCPYPETVEQNRIFFGAELPSKPLPLWDKGQQIGWIEQRSSWKALRWNTSWRYSPRSLLEKIFDRPRNAMPSCS